MSETCFSGAQFHGGSWLTGITADTWRSLFVGNPTDIKIVSLYTAKLFYSLTIEKKQKARKEKKRKEKSAEDATTEAGITCI